MIKDIIQYAQGTLGDADKLYNTVSTDFQKGKDHFLLKSDHLDERAARHGQNSAHYIPEINPAIRSRVAQIFDVFTSGSPSIRCTPVFPDLPGVLESAARNEKWINTTFDLGRLWLDLYMAWINAEVYPLGAVYLRWKDKWDKVPQVDQMGGISYSDMVTYSGGVYDVLHPDNYRGDLYARTPRDMGFHFIIKDVSNAYIAKRMKEGIYQQYDLEMLKSSAGGTWSTNRRKDRINDDFVKPKGYDNELISAWILDPEDDVWHDIIFSGDLLFKHEIREYEPPIFLFNSVPLPGEIAGLSTALLGDTNQNVINELWNQLIESNEQANWAPILYNGDVTSDPIWEPMALWRVEKPESFRKIVEPNLGSDYIGSIRFLQERDQNMLAAWDTMQPVAENSKQTASEYLGKSESYSKLMSVNLQFYASVVIDSIYAMRRMARENMADLIQLDLMSGQAGASAMTVEDLATDLTIELPNIKTLSREEMEMAKWDTMYPALLQNPLVATNPQAVFEITKRYLESHKEKDIDRIIKMNPVQPTMGGMNAQQQTQSGQPQQAPAW